MDDRAAIGPGPDPRERDEWTGITFLLGEMGRLRARGLVRADAYRTIVSEYSARREEIERLARFAEAIGKARDLATLDPNEAIRWTGLAREFGPDRREGWELGAALLREAKRFDEADRLSRELAARFSSPDPASRAGSWASPATAPKRGTPSRVVKFLDELQAPPAVEMPPASPKVSWAGVAGEFLQEHWQKLISALAVLLIVVSSTIGASLVLGPLLWSPVGKGGLALAFTATCAAFGVGLARWGAERAGRMMLATSLIVVPINLMLLGELCPPGGPTLAESGLMALDAALLFALTRWAVDRLGIARGGTFAGAFFALAAFNVGIGPGRTAESGLAVFLAPGVVFLAATAWLNRRAKVGGEPGRADLAYLEFGLLGFAYLSGVLRTGGLVLHLGPSLYAVPAMLAAIAAISTARAIAPIEKDRRTVLLLQQGGLALSVLAFALALARPPGPSALHSGNTLAVALLGLALYATSLRATRLPAYLYAGFAALFLAYFGTFYFAADLVRSVEEAARRAMGYDRKLPLPFKAINGLAFNLGLAWLARFFALRWSDDRLAGHCHRIGLPLSIAACVLAGFEPKAAVVCLGGYAVLYAAASRFYAAPRLVYLACAATTGLVFFGSTVAGATGLDVRALLASLVGLAFWAIRSTPGLVRAGEPYRIPLGWSARALACVGMATAATSAAVAGSIAPVATLAFLVAAATALLDGRESPRVSAYLLAIAALLGAWLGGWHLAVGTPQTPMAHGLMVAGFAVALLLAAEGAREWLESSDPVEAFLEAMGRAVPVLVLLAWALAGWAWVDSSTVARAVLVGSSALLWLTRFRREPALVYLGLAGVAAWAACVCGLVVPGGRPGLLASWLAMTTAGGSLAAWGAGELARRRDDDFYGRPCFRMAAVLAVGASVLGAAAFGIAAQTTRVDVAALLLAGTSLGLVAASRRQPSAVGLAVGSVVGAGCLALLGRGADFDESARMLALGLAVGAIACRGVGMILRKGAGDPATPMARPLDFWAFALLVAAVAPGFSSPATLLVVAAACPLLIAPFPSNAWLYGTFGAIVAAAWPGWLAGLATEALVLPAVLAAYAAWGVGLALWRWGPRLLGRVGRADLNLHEPPARVAVGLGLLAAILRLRASFDFGIGWEAQPWLPWSLATLCLLMMRFDPSRGWVHAAVALTGLGYAATLASWAGPAAGWYSASMALATLWWLAGRGAERVEPAIRRRLGWAEGRFAPIVDGWSRAAFGLSGLALASTVLMATFLPDAAVDVGWWDVTIALGLSALFVGLDGDGPAPTPGSWGWRRWACWPPGG